MHLGAKLMASVVAVLAVVAFVGGPALAQSGNPALDHCRETVGRPIVMACMQRGGGDIEGCRRRATPAVRRCMAARGGGGGAPPARQEASATNDTGETKLAILMPGAGGAVSSDFLVRNKGRIGGSGVSVVLTTSPREAASLAQGAAAKGRRVILVGMSRGSLDVANALRAGAKANGVVLVSGPYAKVQSVLGSPSRLPATLAVHHRNDGCPSTPAAALPSFVSWSGGRVSARWISNQGSPVPNPCGPRGAHGFYMQDGDAVAAINGFVRSR